VWLFRSIKVDDLEKQFVATTTNRGRLLIFPISELPILSKGKGNKLIQMNCSLISYNVVVKWHIRTQTDKQRNTHQTKTDKTKYKARPKKTFRWVRAI
jgi:DNA gyrase/topoisomerase IV subunit A